jgi:hypothetical protein
MLAVLCVSATIIGALVNGDSFGVLDIAVIVVSATLILLRIGDRNDRRGDLPSSPRTGDKLERADGEQLCDGEPWPSKPPVERGGLQHRNGPRSAHAPGGGSRVTHRPRRRRLGHAIELEQELAERSEAPRAEPFRPSSLDIGDRLPYRIDGSDAS